MTIADVLSGREQSSKHRRCASCAKPLPLHRRKGAAPKHCQTRRCRKIYYSGAQRTKCQRCSDLWAVLRGLVGLGGRNSMTLWTCTLCGWQGREQMRGHKAWRCPEQGNLKRNLEKALKPKPPGQLLPCKCGCVAEIEQVKGQRKKHFVDREHYEKWRAHARMVQAARDAEGMAAEETPSARRLAEEVAPVAAREAEARRAAEQVPMVTGMASFRLWARCLGFNAGDAATGAA